MKIKNLICSLVMTALVVSASLTTRPATVYALDATKFTYNFKGTEDATEVSHFGNNYMYQNQFKMWSVYKGMGMTDEQACAALGVAACEGGFSSEGIEYATSAKTASWTEGEDSAGNSYPFKGTGSHTYGAAMQALHGDGYSWTMWSEEQYDAYVEVYSERIYDDPDFRTDCTDDTILSYGVDPSYIPLLHRGEAGGSLGTSWSWTIQAQFYYYPESEHRWIGYIGSGLYGFTGGNLYNLFKWSDIHNSDWWNMDTQLAFFVSNDDWSYPKFQTIQAYIDATRDSTLEECVEAWVPYIAGEGTTIPDDWMADRKEEANNALTKFRGKKFDKAYARDVLNEAGLEAVDIGSGIRDRGIIPTFMNTVISYPQSDGMLFSLEGNNTLKANNQAVFKGYIDGLNGVGDSSTSYSLFELFGEDLHWYRYFGERTYTPNLADHIYSAVDQHKVKDLFTFDTIDYEANNYLSCQVYPGRPFVLTGEDLKNGSMDPRSTKMAQTIFGGFGYTDGSFKLAACKYIVSIVTFMMGPELHDTAISALEKIEASEAWDIIQPMLLFILGLVMVFFIFSIVGKALKYSKGTGSAREIFERFFIGVLCLGLFGVAAANPSALNNVTNRTVNVIDAIFNSALAEDLQEDEVIAVTDESIATHAAIWRRALFGPWCRGQFEGRNYEELYTVYSSLGTGQSAMPQSHETIDMLAGDGVAFYDSASYTGDISVPIGGGREIKNWAAYLYSCGTKYHIDSTIDKKSAATINVSNQSEIYFPNTSLKTTAGNPNITADVFRVIDAQMNISPQHYANGSIVNNYDKSAELDPHFTRESFVMIFNTSLLIFMVPVIWKKITSFILLLITTFKMIYFTILELFKEGNGIKELLDSIKKHFFDYFVSCLKLCLMVSLYYRFVDQGFFKLLLYVVLCIVILAFSLDDVRQFGYDVKYKFKRFVNRF